MPTSKLKPSPVNLPVPLSAFIGREREIAELGHLLTSSRLVTLTGPGGSGKTRLSLKVAGEIAREFDGGTWFVELAAVTDPHLVPQTVASTLNIREQSGRTLMDVVINHLSGRKILLIIDNCEHLVSACAQFADTILQGCPQLKILATSREPLGIPGEFVWAVPPLSMPIQQPWTNPASAQRAVSIYEESESVQLFVARAAAISPEFHLTAESGPWVAEICRHLDGMPLAIELAAARVRSLSVQQIAQRLDDRFHLLTGGSRTAPLRQRTLESALDWSYALLSAPEQKVLQRFSVFFGGATLNAAEAVCANDGAESADVLDVLSHLVDKSLVTAGRSERGEMRYGLLETIRQYAHEKLSESGELEKIRDGHLAYFAQWAEKTESSLNRVDQMLSLDRYEAEYDNLHAALDWSLISEGNAVLGLQMAGFLEWFWTERGHFSQPREQLAALLEKTKNDNRAEVRARALSVAGGLAFIQTDYPTTRALVEESVSIYRELGAAGRPGLANALIRLGDMWRQSGGYETALSQFEEGLRLMRELNDLDGVVRALWQLGYHAVSLGEYQQADQYFKEALPLSRQQSIAIDTTVILSGLAESAVRQGDYGRAAAFEEEGLMLRRAIGEKWGIAVSLGNFAWVALHQNELGKAQTLLMESFTVRHEIQDQGGMAWCLEKLAKINILSAKRKSGIQSTENFRRAAQLFGAAAALRAPVGSVIDQADQLEYDRDLEVLRTALGEAAFSDLWKEGDATPLEELIDTALADSSDELLKTEKEKYNGLTAREREVAALIAQGKPNREIAKVMTVGAKTVETYVTRILNKLGFDSRVQIATWAVEKRLTVIDKP